jgi:hypothetical protein
MMNLDVSSLGDMIITNPLSFRLRYRRHFVLVASYKAMSEARKLLPDLAPKHQTASLQMPPEASEMPLICIETSFKCSGRASYKIDLKRIPEPDIVLSEAMYQL